MKFKKKQKSFGNNRKKSCLITYYPNTYDDIK